MMKRCFWLLARLLAVGAYVCVELVLGVQDTPTSDEARHVRDGAAILATGRIGVNPEHPPLVKVLCALALPVSERHSGMTAATGDPMTADARFAVSLRLVGSRLLRARIPAICLAAIGLVAFGSLFSRVSPAGGFFATLMLGVSTPFLAHGHYVTTDLAPVTFALMAVWALMALRWPWAPVLAGVFLGATLMAKFSAPLLFPFIVLFAFFRLRWRGAAVVAVGSLIVAFGIEAYATRGMTRDDLRSLSERAFLHGGLGGPAPASPALARSSERLIALSPPLGAYWVGFWDVAHRSATSEWADYWMGRIVTGPQPLYPVATLAFKDDLPFLALALLGAIVAISRSGWRFGREACLTLAGGLLYLALASRSSLHLGVRHLLPLVVLLAAVAAVGFLQASHRLRLVFWSLVAAHLVVAAIDYPHFTSARNTSSRLFMPRGQSYDLSDDWGQDLGRFLKRWSQPVEYLALVHYRIPDWNRLFPEVHSPPCATCSYHLVDQIVLDIIDASSRGDVPAPGRRELAQLQPLLSEVARIRHQGRPIPIAEPTLRLFATPSVQMVAPR